MLLLRNIFFALLFILTVPVNFIYAQLEPSAEIHLTLGKENVYEYIDELSKKNAFVPPHPMIPALPGFKIDRAQYKEVYKLKLSYVKNQEPVTKEVAGKYWNISVRMIDWDKKAYRDEILKQFEEELTRLGGKVLAVEKFSVVFKYKYTWGRFYAYNNSCKIKMVEEEGAERETPDDSVQLAQTQIDAIEELEEKVDDIVEAEIEEKLSKIDEEEAAQKTEEVEKKEEPAKAEPKQLIVDIDTLKTKLDKKSEAILEGLSFESGKAKLTHDTETLIKDIAALLKQYTKQKFEIQGHTDSLGTRKSNLKLSSQRADAVKEALIKAGVKKELLVSKGYGEAVPITPNKTEEDREKNRRIVLKPIIEPTKKAREERKVVVEKEEDDISVSEPEVSVKNGVITIDSIKPLSGFKKATSSKYSEIKLHLTINGIQNGINIAGAMLKHHYIAQQGKVSWKSIMDNYKKTFEKLGAEFLGDYKKNIYFYFNNRGDGKETYVILSAYNVGDYTVTFVIPPG